MGSVHLVSYFGLADVVPHNRLPTPSTQRELEAFALDPALLVPEHFRVAPIVEVDGSGILRYRGEGRQAGMLSPAIQSAGLPADEGTPMDELPSFDFSSVPGPSTTASSSGTRSSGMASPGVEAFDKSLASPMPTHASLPIPVPMQFVNRRIHSSAGHGSSSAPSSCAPAHCSAQSTDSADTSQDRLSVSSDGTQAPSSGFGPTVEYRPRAASVSMYDSILFGKHHAPHASTASAHPSYEARPQPTWRMSPYSRCDVLPPAAPPTRPALRHYNFGQQSPPLPYEPYNYAAAPSHDPPRPDAYPRYVAPSFPHDFGNYSLGGDSALSTAPSYQPPQLTPRPSAGSPSGLVGAAPLSAYTDRGYAHQPTHHVNGTGGSSTMPSLHSPAPAPLYRHERYSPFAEWPRMA